MIAASVIIATCNRAGRLRECLAALQNQTHSFADYEVLVVVDGSTDDTLEMLAGLRAPFSLRVIDQPNRGQSAALNRGAAEALGRICIFLDDDIKVNRRFVSEHISLHNRSARCVGIGQITLTLPPEADWFARGFARGWDRHYARLNQGVRLPGWQDCYGGNMSVSRAAFLEVGGHATDLRRGYDVELAYRLERYGCFFEYLPHAVGDQYECKGFRELSTDAELAGEASAILSRRYPSTQPELLGKFWDKPLSSILLWRLLRSLNVSAQRLERLLRLFGRSTQTFAWFQFMYNYCFWKGVRGAAPDC